MEVLLERITHANDMKQMELLSFNMLMLTHVLGKGNKHICQGLLLKFKAIIATKLDGLLLHMPDASLVALMHIPHRAHSAF